jgi:hypothetical protein
MKDLIQIPGLIVFVIQAQKGLTAWYGVSFIKHVNACYKFPFIPVFLCMSFNLIGTFQSHLAIVEKFRAGFMEIKQSVMITYVL